MADEIERLAMEELLRETKRAKERADVMGAMGWKKGMASANKTFLANTLVSTLRDYRHMDRDRKQRSDDKKDSKQESESGRHESRRKHSPDNDRKSDRQSDRSSRNRRQESPERKHKKRNSIDRKDKKSPERERKDSLRRSSLEEERRDVRRTSQKSDRIDSKRKESSETRVKSDKIRKVSSDEELSDSKVFVDSKLYKIDLATIPLPESKDTVSNKNTINELKQSVSSMIVQEENTQNDILKLPENDKSDVEQGGDTIEKEQPILEIVGKDTMNSNGQNESSDLTNMQKEIKDSTSIVEMDINEVPNDKKSVQEESGDLNEKINKKKKKTRHNSKTDSNDLKTSEKYSKADKHKKQKEQKKSENEKCNNDELDKHEIGSNKLKGKCTEKDEQRMIENSTETDNCLNDKNSDFEDEKNKDKKSEDCIERKEELIESIDKVDKNEVNMKDQMSTDANDAKDTERKSKRTDSESEKQEKRKRKKEKSGHHHKHKKHKKDSK